MIGSYILKNLIIKNNFKKMKLIPNKKDKEVKKFLNKKNIGKVFVVKHHKRKNVNQLKFKKTYGPNLEIYTIYI